MDDVTRHPDDATLFDLVEGALEPARAEEVQAHLARCSACAAFVTAARAGAPAASGAVEAMPAEAAANLHADVTTAWRERVAGIAAAEAAQDVSAPSAVPVPTTALVPDGAPARASDPVRAPSRWRGRRLVPVLAFVVLGTLAGTSVFLGDETSDKTTVARDNGGETSDAVPSSEAPMAGAPPEAAVAPSAGDTAVSADAGGAAAGASGQAGTATSAPAAGAPVDATAGAGAGDRANTQAGAEAAKATKDTSASVDNGTSGATSSPSVGTVPPPADYDAFVGQQRLCIATLDETRLVLPDGRIPTQITQGPFGFYLVCG